MTIRRSSTSCLALPTKWEDSLRSAFCGRALRRDLAEDEASPIAIGRNGPHQLFPLRLTVYPGLAALLENALKPLLMLRTTLLLNVPLPMTPKFMLKPFSPG